MSAPLSPEQIATMLADAQGNDVAYLKLLQNHVHALAAECTRLQAEFDRYAASTNKTNSRWHHSGEKIKAERDEARAEVEKLRDVRTELLVMGARFDAVRRNEQDLRNAVAPETGISNNDACTIARRTRAEIAKLREALIEISSVCTDDGDPAWAVLLQRIARAALKETP